MAERIDVIMKCDVTEASVSYERFNRAVNTSIAYFIDLEYIPKCTIKSNRDGVTLIIVINHEVCMINRDQEEGDAFI